MQTPDTPRGRETERLMRLWRKQNPGADTSAYNREWSATYAKLEFLDAEEMTQAKLDWLWNYLREMGCRTFEEMTSEDHVKLAEAFFSGRIQFESAQRTGKFESNIAFEGTLKTQRGFLDHMGDTNRRVLLHPARTMSAFGTSNDRPKKPKRICKANYPATKGAFGKPKHLRRR